MGSLVAGLGGYAYQFIGGRALGEEGFAPYLERVRQRASGAQMKEAA